MTHQSIMTRRLWKIYKKVGPSLQEVIRHCRVYSVETTVFYQKNYTHVVLGWAERYIDDSKTYLTSRKYVTKINGLTSEDTIQEYLMFHKEVYYQVRFILNIHINHLCNLNMTEKLLCSANNAILLPNSRFSGIIIMQTLVQVDVDKII